MAKLFDKRAERENVRGSGEQAAVRQDRRRRLQASPTMMTQAYFADVDAGIDFDDDLRALRSLAVVLSADIYSRIRTREDGMVTTSTDRGSGG